MGAGRTPLIGNDVCPPAPGTPSCTMTGTETGRQQRWRPVLRLSKKSKDFSDSLQKCRYFCAPQRRKSPRFACRNPCTARFPGHLIPFEAGRCPPELPRPD